MISLASLRRLRDSRTLIEHNGEWWTVSDADECTSNDCPRPDGCAGNVALRHSSNHGHILFGWHVDAAADLTEPNGATA